MSKIVLDNIVSGYNLNKINENFDKIETHLNNKVFYRDNPIGEVNTVKNSIDMDSNDILNVRNLRVLGSATLNGVNFDEINSAFVWRDIWDNSVTYAENDAVSYQGSSFIAKIPNLGVVPVQGATWGLLSEKGDIGPTAGSADLISYTPAGAGAVTRTVQDKLRESVSVKDFGAVGDGVTNDTAAIALADAAANQIDFPAGTYIISNNVTFTARVVMQRGAKIKTSSSAYWIKFTKGFEAPADYVLDVDGPTQFFNIDHVVPQWFGSCGLDSVDSTIPLTRAFRALRAASSAGPTSAPDALTGCHRIRFPLGVYRCNAVPVYSQAIIDGEVTGSLMNSLIQQIDRTIPALYVCPKNYGVDGTILNNSVGQNFFHRMGFRSEVISDSAENEPILKFLSPAQATTLLAVSGDTVGTVGHIDTMFERCWLKDSAGSGIGCDEGVMGIHIRGTTFDVCRRAVRWSGTATGFLRSYNNIYYGCVRGAFENVTTSASGFVNLYSYGDEFKAGNCYNATTTYRRAINWAPTNVITGSQVKISNAMFLRTDGLGTRVGGNILLNSEYVEVSDFYFKDPDSTFNQKAIAVQDGVKYLILRGTIVSDSLNSYANSRLISISQSTQALVDCNVDVRMINSNASAIVDGIQSDFVFIGGKFNIEFKGPFTNQYSVNISASTQRNSIARTTVERFGTAAPVAGTWSIGDRVINSVPTVGQPKAWVCTVAGAPGTWVSEGNL